MLVGVLKESFPGERRVALVPADLPRLQKRGISVVLEQGAGAAAGYPDAEYAAKGARFTDRSGVFGEAELIAQVRSFGANPEAGRADLAALTQRHAVVGFMDPLGSPALAGQLGQSGVTAFAMELVPRITRAQSMDALSSMANLAGYQAVLLAAVELPKMLPMMMTAAGTVAPAHFFVLGAGVAGLQAIATARRLGAVVSAYDIRPEVKDQVQSVGGTFVQLELETTQAGDAGGYAKAQSEEFYRRQQEQLAVHIRAADAIITTAAIPGRRAPILVTRAMMAGMRPGSVLVDIAAETGGNCEATVAGQTVVHDGVRVVGPVNLPASLPFHASQLYSRNIVSFLEHLTKDGKLELKLEDEITAQTLVCRGGEVVHSRVKQLLN